MRDITGNAADHAPSGSWDSDRDRWQEILNERPIPPRRSQRDCLISVEARVAWERDGVEVLRTRAVAWAGDDVLVEVPDRRWRMVCVWLAAADVRRV